MGNLGATVNNGLYSNNPNAVVQVLLCTGIWVNMSQNTKSFQLSACSNVCLVFCEKKKNWWMVPSHLWHETAECAIKSCYVIKVQNGCPNYEVCNYVVWLGIDVAAILILNQIPLRKGMYSLMPSHRWYLAKNFWWLDLNLFSESVSGKWLCQESNYQTRSLFDLLYSLTFE